MGPNPLLGLSCKVLSAGFAVFCLLGYANRGTVGSIAPQRSPSVTLRTGSQTARRGGDARAIYAPALRPGRGGWHSRVQRKTYPPRRRELCRRGQAGGSSGNYRSQSLKVLERAVKGMGAIADRLLRCACKRRLRGGGNDSVREPMHSLGTSWPAHELVQTIQFTHATGSGVPRCRIITHVETPVLRHEVSALGRVSTGTES